MFDPKVLTPAEKKAIITRALPDSKTGVRAYRMTERLIQKGAYAATYDNAGIVNGYRFTADALAWAKDQENGE
jgi:hypothetical protein